MTTPRLPTRHCGRRNTSVSLHHAVSGRGFTLIEMLIAVTLLGIVAALAVPQYGAYVMRGRILDGFAKLADYRARMEQYFLDRRSYIDDAGNCGVAPPPTAASGDSFEVRCIATPRSYVYTAAGIAAKGMTGFVYTIDHADAHVTVSVPKPWLRTGDCWTFRPDGSCV